MKILNIIFFLSVSLRICIAQDNKVSMELKKWESILAAPLGDSGFILKVESPMLAGKGENPLKFYTAESKLIWERIIVNEYGLAKRNAVLVATPNGSMVYNVELKSDAYHSSDHFVTQISREGHVKKFVIEGRKELGKSLQTIFCDEN